MWLSFTLFIIAAIVFLCRGSNLPVIYPISLLVGGTTGILIVPYASVSDDKVIILWALGLRKRIIPFCMISSHVCSSMGVKIFVIGGQSCTINFGNARYNVRFDLYLRSKLGNGRGPINQ